VFEKKSLKKLCLVLVPVRVSVTSRLLATYNVKYSVMYSECYEYMTGKKRSWNFEIVSYV